MRDLAAGIIALGLLLMAASLATALHAYRRRRRRTFDSEQEKGRTIIAELPTAEELVLFSEDADCFYYGDRAIDKNLIVAGRVLINGSPIAVVLSARHARASGAPATSFEDRPEGIARDRWDVAIETLNGTVLVECGSIRERVSQELARAVFEAVRLDVGRKNAVSS
ncbi:MAG: hypothetical protein DMF89_22910 [Acidobacteria bacterium]|nr:MAG: hypothetical protein DMF89_22910 [Acidobacteriota bacterium]